jgi:hypothetical protein
MMSLSSISEELLELFKALDEALSQADNTVLAAAIPLDNSVIDVGLLIAAVQNLLCDYHMFLIVRVATSLKFVADSGLVEVLGERFNRIRNDNVSDTAARVRAEIERCSRSITELLLCLDADSLRSIPPESALVPEYLMRTLALERDLAWIQEFHVLPNLAPKASTEG